MLAAKGLMKKDIMCKMVNKCRSIEQIQNFKYLPYEEIENGMFCYWKGFYLREGGQLKDR